MSGLLYLINGWKFRIIHAFNPQVAPADFEVNVKNLVTVSRSGNSNLKIIPLLDWKLHPLLCNTPKPVILDNLWDESKSASMSGNEKHSVVTTSKYQIYFKLFHYGVLLKWDLI